MQELELNSVAARMTFVAADGAAPAPAFEKEVVKVRSAEDIAAIDGGDRVSVLIGAGVSFSFGGGKEYEIDCAEDLFAEGMSFDDAVAAVKPRGALRAAVGTRPGTAAERALGHHAAQRPRQEFPAAQPG